MFEDLGLCHVSHWQGFLFYTEENGSSLYTAAELKKHDISSLFTFDFIFDRSILYPIAISLGRIDFLPSTNPRARIQVKHGKHGKSLQEAKGLPLNPGCTSPLKHSNARTTLGIKEVGVPQGRTRRGCRIQYRFWGMR